MARASWAPGPSRASVVGGPQILRTKVAVALVAWVVWVVVAFCDWRLESFPGFVL